jgi:hypothetical protein
MSVQKMTGNSSVDKCDYSKISVYKSGEFNVKYKTDILSVSTILPITLETDFIAEINAVNSFLNGEYVFLQLNEPIILYRVFGVYKDSVKSYGNGRFFTTEFAESKIDVKMRLALFPEWNTRMYEEKIKVPRGTKVYYGIAAPQVREKEDKCAIQEEKIIYPGGAEQIVIDDKERMGLDDWVEGYRYITARQLDKMPDYPFRSVNEVIKEKDKLYPIVCPRCKSVDVSKTIIDGYIYECKLCNYVW